jgi:transforming growth factor-beta-induced protein
MKKFRMTVLGAAVLASLAAVVIAGGATAAPARSAAPGTIVQVAAGSPQFSTLVALVKKAGLAGALSKGHLTVFAPTNAAFAYLKTHDPATYKAATTNAAVLKKVLTYHVVGRRILAPAAIAAAKAHAKVTTLEGEKIALSLVGGKIKLNGDATVVVPNILASNGVIHVINRVLVPPSLMQPPAPTQSILQIAEGNPDFSTLVSLVQQAGLVQALSGAGPFTVFAPTNEAFQKLAAAAPATYQAVLASPTLLAKVLTYHVVSGAITGAQAIAAAQQNGTVTSLEGEPISLSLVGGNLTLDGTSTVVTPNILATNGIIHVIDTVLVPPSLATG